MIFSAFTRPEYLLRPTQVVKRILWGFNKNKPELQVLVHGLPINVSAADELGRSIYGSGIYDLCLTEALWRLTIPGSTCIDIGANIGYASSIMTKRSGTRGKLFAFEPHPEIFKELSKNIELWRLSGSISPITAIEKGISNFSGERNLNIPPDFKNNRGMSHFYEQDDKPEISSGELLVSCTTLDDFAEANSLKQIDLIKVDAEGHEMQVLQSAQNLLSEKRIINIVFEDSRGSWRTPKLLYQDYGFIREKGYQIFRLKRGMLGPKLESIEDLKDDDVSVWQSWEPPNFIATLNGTQIKAAFNRPGWYSLLNRDFR